MSIEMISDTVLKTQKASGFGSNDEVGELNSFIDLSTLVEEGVAAAPLFPVSTTTSSFANAFSASLRQQDSLLDSPLGLSPQSLSASPFDFASDYYSSPLLESSAYGSSTFEGLQTPELDSSGDRELPSLFFPNGIDGSFDGTTDSSPNWSPEDVPLALPSVCHSPSVKTEDILSLSISPSMTRLPSSDLNVSEADDSRVLKSQEHHRLQTKANAEHVKDKFTGTRNTKIPPIPFEAPTMTRSYVIPSITSRKRAPAAISAKLMSSTSNGGNVKKTKGSSGRAVRRESTPLSVFDGYEGDGLDPSDLPDELLSAIELKRRQNTLAARRSRMRKAGHLAEMQATVDELEGEVSEWKEKYEQMEILVRQLRGEC